MTVKFLIIFIIFNLGLTACFDNPSDEIDTDTLEVIIVDPTDEDLEEALDDQDVIDFTLEDPEALDD